jgi:hypothetical protein
MSASDIAVKSSEADAPKIDEVLVGSLVVDEASVERAANIIDKTSEAEEVRKVVGAGDETEIETNVNLFNKSGEGAEVGGKSVDEVELGSGKVNGGHVDEGGSNPVDLDNILKLSRKNPYVKEIESKTSIEAIRNSEATSFKENFIKELDDEGLTMDEYISVTHTNMKDLSEDMIKKIDKINQSVEMPNNATLMSKVIPENSYKNCINNEDYSDTVGNCITRARDMQDCYSYDDYYKKPGLNYINADGTVSVYTNPDTQALYIERFTSSNTEDYVVHSYGGNTDEDVKMAQNVLGLDDSNTFKMDSPYLGTGVTKDIDGGIGKLEFMALKGKYCKISNGAAIYKLERGSSKEILVAVRIKGKWYEIID